MIFLWGPSCSGAEARQDAPNIVFILADDLSWSDLGCYGNTVHETPHLDQLAQEGLLFKQAYAPAPICSASRAAILTGKTPARLNFEFVTKAEPGQQTLDVPLQSPPFTLNLPLQERTMGELLQQAGFVTGFFGKWHVSQHHQGYLGWSPSHGPFQQGFQFGDPSFGCHPYAYRSDKSLKSQQVPPGEFPTDELHDQALAFLKQNRNQRFFLYLSEYFVHDPIHTRCDWLKDRSTPWCTENGQNNTDKAAQRLPADAQPIRRDYAAMVATLDHLVGRVLSALDELKLTDRTLVVFTSDNGGHPNYTSNAPLRGSKWNLYEGGIRVPMLLRWPGKVAGGTRSDAVVHGCDLLPTFCDIAQLSLKQSGKVEKAATAEISAAWDGESLVPWLLNRDAVWERESPLIWHFPYYHPEKGFSPAPRTIGVADFVTSQTRPHSALRDGAWKLLYFHEDQRTELYHLANDLSEQQNLATEHPQRAAQMLNKLRQQLNAMQARWPR